MSQTEREYDPFDDDLPRVQIPVGRDRPGLSIDGDFMTLFELPDDAAEAYIKYAEQGGNIRLRQCDRCGYLTDADAASPYEYDSYSCPNCNQTASKSFDENFIRLDHNDPESDRYLDIPALVPESKCEADHGASVPDDRSDMSARRRRYHTPDVDEEAVECSRCVPNHPSHLGRLQNAVEGEMTRGEMMQTVAEAVKAFREA